jgi:Zn-dependent peptidase ImmA (M78 family)
MGRLTDQQIEVAAQALRRKEGFENQDRFCIVALLNNLSFNGQRFEIHCVPDEELVTSMAQWDSIERRVTIRDSIYELAKLGNPRAVLTIAEEIAHIELGHTGIRNRSLSKSQGEKYDPEIKREEREAKRFAAALLAPLTRCKYRITVEEICDRFGLSREAALRRVEEMAKIAPAIHASERELPATVVDFLREAKKRGVDIKTYLD